MKSPKEDVKLMNAVSEYLAENNYVLPDGVTFGYVIDGVDIYIGEFPVLRIGLPPVSDYPVKGTEYTEKLLRKESAIA